MDLLQGSHLTSPRPGPRSFFPRSADERHGKTSHVYCLGSAALHRSCTMVSMSQVYLFANPARLALKVT